MTSGMQDNPPATASPDGPLFRPFTSTHHHVTKSRYITSNDSRGYIPVYEYPLRGQWIMMDADDGYILWTGIWKALGNSKADIIKMIESQPELAGQIRRVRGGYLKIQGTWMPYEVALRLARRVAFEIRFDLVPLFGPTFPDTCLRPDQAGYGQVVPAGTGRRRTRRTAQNQHPFVAATDISGGQHDGWTVYSPPLGQPPVSIDVHSAPFAPAYMRPSTSDTTAQPSYHQPPSPALSADGGPERYAHVRPNSRSSRYSPYPGPPSSAYTGSYGSHHTSPIDVPQLSSSYPTGAYRQTVNGDQIPIASVQATGSPTHYHQPSFSLPPISVLTSTPPSSSNDPRAVLHRLRFGDDNTDSDQFHPPSRGQLQQRRRSISQPPVVSYPKFENMFWSPSSVPTSHPRWVTEGPLYAPIASDRGDRSDLSFPSPSNSPTSSINERISVRDQSPNEPVTPPPNFITEMPSGLTATTSTLPARSKNADGFSFVSRPRGTPLEAPLSGSAGADWSGVQRTAAPQNHRVGQHVADVPYRGYETEVSSRRENADTLSRTVRPW